MLTLYTAVGKCRLLKKENGEVYPVVLLGRQELLLDPHEMLLWSSLAFSILTHREAKSLFYEREAELHMLGDIDFEHYLKRLIFRGLVASGTDCTGINALYQLLDPLYVRPEPASLFVRLAALADMVFVKHFPLKSALRIAGKEKLTPAEKQFLGRKDLVSLPIQQLLLTDPSAQSGHQPITALANLYFKKQIILDIL